MFNFIKGCIGAFMFISFCMLIIFIAVQSVLSFIFMDNLFVPMEYVLNFHNTVGGRAFIIVVTFASILLNSQEGGDD